MFSCGLASNILSYIAILAPVIPFLVLMVTWFVGINGVYRGRIFHYFL
jgi:hypothetical protein